MTEPIWAQPFPAGVADAGLAQALVMDATGHCVAMRLADGQRLWRSQTPLRPLWLDDKLAMTLAMAPPQVVALDLHGPRAGQERWRSAALPWPGWTLQEASFDAAHELHAASFDGQLLLVWCLYPSDAGGALRADLSDTVRTLRGACVVQLATGALQALPSWPDPPPSDDAKSASTDAAVLAQRVLADVRYRLLQQHEAGRLRLSLSAQRCADGKPLWSHALDDVPARRPAPPRP